MTRRSSPSAPRLRARRSLPLAATALPLSGCAGVQSALDPAAGDAVRLLGLTWLLTVGGTAIFVVVMALLAYAILAPEPSRRWLASRRTVVAGGLVFPVVALTILLGYGLFVLRH